MRFVETTSAKKIWWNHMRHLQRILTGAVTTALLLFGLSFSAQAQVTDGTRSAITPAAVPSCVTWGLDDDEFEDILAVYNACTYTVRIKVILANADDFPCYSFPSFSGRYYTWNYPGRFDRLESC